MRPTDPSDAHLGDRAIEIRALKAGVVVFLVTIISLFFSLLVALGVFVVAYVAYKYSYYSDRIGVFTSDDLSVRHNRLELGLIAASVVALVVLFAVEVIFPTDWTLGGFLSLPPMDLMDPDSLIADPAVPLAWLTVLAPVVAVSYAGHQLRYRLLFGLDSDDAVIRAIIWESVARIPVYLVWVGVLTTRPIYDVWQPAIELGAGVFGLTAGTSGEFAILLGGSFPSIVVGGLSTPIVVIASYIGIQRWKYDDATIPEVFGDLGIAPPTSRSHQANRAVPIAVFLLYTLAVFIAMGAPPITDLRLVVAAVVAVIVGADVLGRTSILVRSASERVADTVDAIVTGFVVGFVALVVLSTLFGARGTFVDVALAYPIIALPLTHLGNLVAGRYAVDDTTEIVDGLESDPDGLRESDADRLFVYSEARDETLRATAIDGLVTVIQVSSYRQDDAVAVFVRALDSDDAAIVQAGLRGISTVLATDRSVETYDRLVDAGCRELITSHLDRDDEVTQSRAAEAAARLFAIGLKTTPTDLADHLPSGSRIERMTAAVDRNPEDRPLASAVVSYFARVWYAMGQSGTETLGPTEDDAQHLLGGLIRLSEYADDDARLTAVLAVTAGRAAADVKRFSLAKDRLKNETEEVRYLAIHIARSSIDRHADRVDPQEILELLDDPSEEVRQAGARTITTFVQFAPDRASGMLDRLVLHLQEHLDDPGLTEGDVIRALNAMDIDSLIDHPTAAPAIAGYVDGTSRPIAEPAAEVLSSMVRRAPVLAQDDMVSAAIDSGLTGPSEGVRLDSLEAVVAVIDDSVDDGRRFVDGLCENLSTGGDHGRLAAVCLAELLEAFPEDGVDVLPALSTGIGNLTSIDRQAAPFVVRGSTVSAVTVDVLVDVLPLDPGKGEVLIDPLTDVATSADGAELEGIFRLLATLSAEFPAACRVSVGTASAVVEDDRVGVRRAAAEVLANVAARHPAAVEPFVDRLVVATDDDSQRVRAAALVGLTNVCVASPAAIESDIHRVIGLLDDDSASVRERAAHLIVVIAEREPEIIQPAAETADRLRRLQRDPAVDVDAERLQDASTAIQTGVPVEEAQEADRDDGEIWSPETAAEMGASGDTNVFVPDDDAFDIEFDDELESTETTEAPDKATDEAVSEAADDTPTFDNGASAGMVDVADVEDLEKVVGAGKETVDEDATESQEKHGDDVEDLDTAIASASDTAEEEDTQQVSGNDLEELDTVIDPDQDTADAISRDDVEDAETVIEPGEDTADETGPPDDIEGLETAIEPAEDEANATEASAETDDIHELETAIEASANRSEGEDAVDVDDLETAIERGDSSEGESEEAGATDDVADLETTIDPEDDASEGGQPINRRDDTEGPADVEDLETVVEPDENVSESDDADDDRSNES